MAIATSAHLLKVASEAPDYQDALFKASRDEISRSELAASKVRAKSVRRPGEIDRAVKIENFWKETSLEAREAVSMDEINNILDLKLQNIQDKGVSRILEKQVKNNISWAKRWAHLISGDKDRLSQIGKRTDHVTAF
jgi:hypothetical protein